MLGYAYNLNRLFILMALLPCSCWGISNAASSDIQAPAATATPRTQARPLISPLTQKRGDKKTLSLNNEKLYLQARSESVLNPPPLEHATPHIVQSDKQHTSNTQTLLPASISSPPQKFQDKEKSKEKQRAPSVTKKHIPYIAANTPISFEFQNTDLRDVLQAFAAFTNTNLIISDQVQGKISLKLDAVPWRAAFDMLLDTHGLATRERDGVLWIAPITDMVRQERQRVEVQTQALDAGPLTTSIFELHYQRAEEMRVVLNGTGGERFLSKRGVVIADSRTNQLFVLDNAKRIEHIDTLLKAMDRPTPQVSIEARIVEAEEGFSRSLGARLSLLNPAGNAPSPPQEGQSDQKGSAFIAEGKHTPFSHASRFLTAEKNTFYDLSAAALSGFSPANIGFTLFGAGASHIIALELSMLEARGQGKILSSPRVVTADRVKAIIEQGMELPYQAKVGNGVSGVQFRRAGLKLEVTPHIMPNGYVTLEVDVAKDSVGAETLSGPAIHTKHVQTQVHVEDAGTVAIGGIFTQDRHSDTVRLPWLSQLPIVGALFRRSVHHNRKNELLIFLTPHIITPIRFSAHLPPRSLETIPIMEK
jgi:type IV pilus assembly protein PilQ